MQNCPANAIDVTDGDGKRTILHSMARCARCGTCWRLCPMDAIEFEYMMKDRWDEVAVLDLVHCEVCGEALYTVALGNMLTGVTGRTVAPLCTRHREALAMKARTHFAGVRKGRTG